MTFEDPVPDPINTQQMQESESEIFLIFSGTPIPAQGVELCVPIEVREGVKKRFFLGDLSQIWVGGAADSQTFGDIYQPLFFSIKVPKCGWVGQSKPKTKSKFWVKFIKCIL